MGIKEQLTGALNAANLVEFKRLFNLPELKNKDFIDDIGRSLIEVICDLRFSYKKAEVSGQPNQVEQIRANLNKKRNDLLLILDFILEHRTANKPTLTINRQTSNGKSFLFYSLEDVLDVEVFDILVRHGAIIDIHERDRNGNSLIEMAACQESPKALLHLILKYPPNTSNPKTKLTPAYYACFFGRSLNLQFLIRSGFSLSVTQHPFSLVDVCIGEKKHDCLKLLAECDRYIFKIKDMMLALKTAIEFKNKPLFDALLRKISKDRMVPNAAELAFILQVCLTPAGELNDYGHQLVEFFASFKAVYVFSSISSAIQNKNYELFNSLLPEFKNFSFMVKDIDTLLSSCKNPDGKLNDFGMSLISVVDKCDPYYLSLALQIAIENKDTDLFNHLLSKFDSITLKPQQLSWLIHFSMSNAFNGFTSSLIEKIPENLSAEFSDLYFFCINQDDAESMSELFRKKVPIKTDMHGLTPFNISRIYSKQKCATCDASFIADFNLINENGETPFHRALKVGDRGLFNTLVEQNQRSDEKAKENYHIQYHYTEKTINNATLLHYAAYLQAEAIVSVLRLGKIDIDAVDNNGRTALMYALMGPNIESVEVLLKEGASIELFPSNYSSLLAYLIDHDNLVMLPLLQRYGMPLNVYDETGKSALQLCILKKNPAALKTLLPSCLSILEHRDADNETALQLACRLGIRDCVAEILKFSDQLSKEDMQQALHLAVLAGQLDIVKDLIFFNQDLLLNTNTQFQTALHIAITNKEIDIVKFILEQQNIDLMTLLNTKDLNGESCLALLGKNPEFFDIYRDMLRMVQPDLSTSPSLSRTPSAEIAGQIVEEIIDAAFNTTKVKAANVNDKEAEKQEIEAFKPKKKLPVAHRRQAHWANLLFHASQETNAEELKPVGWEQWGIPLDIKLHPKLTLLQPILQKALQKRDFEKFSKHDGVYLVGSEALNALFLKKVDLQSSDSDLLVVGLSLDEVMRVVSENQIKYKFKAGANNRTSITLKFKDAPDIDISCIEASDLQNNILSRDFTMGGLLINVDPKRPEILAPLPWLKDSAKRVIRTINPDPQAAFYNDFILKIRALRLYAKLEKVGVVIEPNTEAALRSPTTSYLNSTTGAKPYTIFRLRKQLEKFLNLSGLSSGHELLKTYNMIDQIKINKADLANLLSRELTIIETPKLDPSTLLFNKKMQCLITSLKACLSDDEVASWQKTNHDDLMELIRDYEGKEGLIKTFGTRFMTCLLLAGVDLGSLLLTPEMVPSVISPL